MNFAQVTDSFVGKPNALTQAIEEARAQGRDLINLISGLPGSQGPSWSADQLSEIFSKSLLMAQEYQPDPMGQISARKSIAQFYEERNIHADPNQILLTPGSSISYWYLFRLLANSGDEILCPSPSYPLFDFIGQLSDVKMTDYPLREIPEAPYWKLDLEELENRVTTKTKAIVLVSPHNPTGYVFDEDELEKIGQIARRHHLTLIHDEVFSEFLFRRKDLPRAAKTNAPLVFTLNGLSKMLALPGLKLGWVLISGDEKLVTEARNRLEMISDTFLPVSEPVQFALPEIFAVGKPLIAKLQAFARVGYDKVKIMQGNDFLLPCPPLGGFYFPLRFLDQHVNVERIAVNLVQKEGVIIHPGTFYDTKGNHLIISFMHSAEQLNKGLSMLINYLSKS